MGDGVLALLISNNGLAKLSALIDPAIEEPLDYYLLLKSGEQFSVNDPLYPVRMVPRSTGDVAFLYGLLENTVRIEDQCHVVIHSRGEASHLQPFTADGGAANDT